MGRLSIHVPHAPIQLEAGKYNYVPPPPSDFTVSVWDRLWNRLTQLTGIRVPLLVGASREICWYMMQLEDIASFNSVDSGASGFGAMVRSARGVKIRSTEDRRVSPWGLYALFVVLLSWLGCLAWSAIAGLPSGLYVVSSIPSSRTIVNLRPLP